VLSATFFNSSKNLVLSASVNLRVLLPSSITISSSCFLILSSYSNAFLALVLALLSKNSPKSAPKLQSSKISKNSESSFAQGSSLWLVIFNRAFTVPELISITPTAPLAAVFTALAALPINRSLLALDDTVYKCLNLAILPTPDKVVIPSIMYSPVFTKLCKKKRFL
jgi:hypothetical protein